MRRLLPWSVLVIVLLAALLVALLRDAEAEETIPAAPIAIPVETEEPKLDDDDVQVTAEELEVDLNISLSMVTTEAQEQIATGWGAWSEAQTWCEEWYMRPCSQDDECASYERCVHPWWADNADSRVCTEKWPSKETRAWRRDRLRTIVDLSCSRRHGCDPRQLHAFLSVVALRESTWRPAKRHRLNPDIEAALHAWRRRAKVFEENSYYAETARWSTGLGMYGMNPSIFVDAWDRAAPPEVLCREVEATAAYLERARRAVRGFRRRKVSPTLCDVHHAVSGGSIEPCLEDGSKKFRQRAERAGIDPDALVTEASFGDPPPRQRPARLAWAQAIHAAIEGIHPRRI